MAKTGGRPKGGKNAPRDFFNVKAKAMGLDLWEECLRLASEESDRHLRFQKMESLLPYIKPKLRSMDVKIDPGADAKEIGSELIGLFKEVLKAKASK